MGWICSTSGTTGKPTKPGKDIWHAAGRKGPLADLLKGLIHLAAAGVKAREGIANGVARHARRAARTLSGNQLRPAGKNCRERFTSIRLATTARLWPAFRPWRFQLGLEDHCELPESRRRYSASTPTSTGSSRIRTWFLRKSGPPFQAGLEPQQAIEGQLCKPLLEAIDFLRATAPAFDPRQICSLIFGFFPRFRFSMGKDPSPDRLQVSRRQQAIRVVIEAANLPGDSLTERAAFRASDLFGKMTACRPTRYGHGERRFAEQRPHGCPLRIASRADTVEHNRGDRVPPVNRGLGINSRRRKEFRADKMAFVLERAHRTIDLVGEVPAEGLQEEPIIQPDVLLEILLSTKVLARR